MVLVKEDEPVVPVVKRMSGLNLAEVNTSRENMNPTEAKNIIAHR